jgi:catechol 2,3-dioxygenase-like lactoylglutathione lyase family enzyme
MPDAKRARAVGFNHIALEVGDIDEALSFYGRIFAFELRGKSEPYFSATSGCLPGSVQTFDRLANGKSP